MTKLGVIGGGTMGGGIAQVAAQQGMDVVLCDVSEELLQTSLSRIGASLQRNVERGRLSQADAAAAAARIVPTTDFADFGSVDCAIEAVIEDIETKRRVFSALDEHLREGAVLATNTSSLSITEIAATTRHPERVVGMHFFNPVPAMALVEVIRGRSTSEPAMERATAIARELGKTPAQCEDTPGFIVNRIVRPFYNEALRILQEGIASHEDIDRIMKGYGFRMGPFELMDLIGNDVNFAVTSSIYEGLFQEPRFRPSFLQQRLVQSGNLGQKTGRGWYDYSASAVAGSEPRRAGGPEGSVPRVNLPTTGPTVIIADSEVGAELADALTKSGCETRLLRLEGEGATSTDALQGCRFLIEATTTFLPERVRPSFWALHQRPSDIPLAFVALTRSAPGASWPSTESPRVCGFGYVPPLADAKVIEVAPGLRTSEAARAAVVALAQALGKEPIIVGDGAGLVGPRIVALIVNEAVQALMEGVASAADIDAAVKLGANYPRGPLEWGDAIGLDTVYAIIKGLQEEHGEDRYRPSPLLRKMVMAGWTGTAAGHGSRTEG
jgi:3-hydroxybutyryl-CoA dehydrogenase